MNIINDCKIDMTVLMKSLEQPQLFQKSTQPFWDDSHVSAQMLKFHLDPDIEAASKTAQTINKEADFIIGASAMHAGRTVLDLGCGPGLYVKQFAQSGAKVTGIDLSSRSIDYANKHIKPAVNNAVFHKMNYLEMDIRNKFDIATLIFFDFCALSPDEQAILLDNIHAALKKNGLFIFDVVTENRQIPVSTRITGNQNGFWSSKPYVEILNTYLYDDPKTEGLQYTLIDEDGAVRVIRIFHRLFSLSEISGLLQSHGFRIENVYTDLSGTPLQENSETLGIVATKLKVGG